MQILDMPEELQIFDIPQCDVDPNVTPEDMFEALLNHCRASREQLVSLEDK